MNFGIYLFPILTMVFLGIFIYVQNTHRHLLATIFKGLASICFLLFAVSQILYVKYNVHDDINLKFTIDILIALGFGVIGDVLLNLRDLFKKPLKDYISLGGVVSFFIGHIFYLIHLFKIMSFKEFSFIDASKVYIPILCSLVLIAILALLVIKFIKKDKLTKIVGIVYISIISLLVCVSLFNLISGLNAVLLGHEYLKNYFIIMFVASFAFASSDVILIFNSFGPHPNRVVSAINLFVYYQAQLLMGLSILYFYLAI